MSNTTDRTPVLLRLDPSLLARIDSRAEALGTSRAALLRDILEAWLEGRATKAEAEAIGKEAMRAVIRAMGH